MINHIKFEAFLEVVIRLILWALFIWINFTDPFVRYIHPNEVWLYKYPRIDSFISSRQLWLIVCLVPSTVFLIEYFISRNTNDIVSGFLTLTLSYGLNGFITSGLKNLVGRPRPDFFYRCFPDGIGDTDLTKCTGERQTVIDGRKSFLSGHSSFSFNCMVFMSLYIGRKVNFLNCSRGQSWRLCLCLLPLLLAASISISRTCDYHHHYMDVVAGAVLGTVIACVTYWMYFFNANTTIEYQNRASQ